LRARGVGDTIERLWAQATGRAGRLPAAALTAQASEEWSFAQTLRHLVFITDDGLARPCQRPPAPGYPEEQETAAGCLAVVMDEEIEHYRLAVRDLTVLESE
jgi:hypothetical protein